ncbi:MAG: HD domain-containing protein [bacterium]|nr:HD domain-containing protein [bacterium]
MPEKFDLEKPNQEDKKNVIEQLRSLTEEKLKNFSDGHGLGHVLKVAELAKLIALGDGKNVFNAEAAALTHDWGRADEASDPKKRKHAELSAIAAQAPYRQFYERGQINAMQYGEIMRAVKRHSLNEKTARETLPIIRDADRLSRFGAVGMYQNTLALSEMANVPFYLKGRPVIREENAPIMGRKDMKCNVDNFNFVLDWRKMMETESGKKIMAILEPSWRAFLELVSNHLETNDKNFWLEYLRSRAEIVQTNVELYKKDPEHRLATFDDQLEMLKQTENVSIFSEEKFQKYLLEHK